MLGNAFLHCQMRGLGKVIKGEGYRYISQLGETFYQGIRESLTISTHSKSITMRNMDGHSMESNRMPFLAVIRIVRRVTQIIRCVQDYLILYDIKINFSRIAKTEI